MFLFLSEFKLRFFTHLLLKDADAYSCYRFIIESKVDGKFKAMFMVRSRSLLGQGHGYVKVMFMIIDGYITAMQNVF